MLQTASPSTMHAFHTSLSTSICQQIGAAGFVHVRAPRILKELDIDNDASRADVDRFRDTWNRLAVDGHMADGGDYRLRRHGVFATAHAGGTIKPAPHRPHYQTVEFNQLNGGIARHFEPLEPETCNNPVFQALMAFAKATFNRLQPFATWDIEVHQFRILAGAGSLGKPTPEGVHRDGVDYVLMMLVARENVVDGETSIVGAAGERLTRFTLAQPFEAAFVDDHRVAHGVTPVMRLDPAREGYRDVLVVTFRRM